MKWEGSLNEPRQSSKDRGVKQVSLECRREDVCRQEDGGDEKKAGHLAHPHAQEKEAHGREKSALLSRSVHGRAGEEGGRLGRLLGIREGAC